MLFVFLDRTTVSKNLSKVASTARTALAPTIKKAAVDNNLCVTSDMWTDNYSHTPYISATAHYIENWNLKSRILFTSEFDGHIRKTGENILTAITKGLQVFDVNQADMKKIKFITDRGSNMIAAFRRHTRLDCIAHLISTCLKHTLGKKHSPIPIQELLSSCTALVKLFKQKPVLNSQLQVCLKLMCDTRFNTVYMMLLPIQTQYHTIYELLQKGGYDVDMVDIIDKALLSSLVAFLKPFYDATNQLEGELAPTIQFVLPIIMRLQNHCAGATDPVMTEEDDHDVMATLRRTCRRLLKEKFKSHTLHKVEYYNIRYKKSTIITYLSVIHMDMCINTKKLFKICNETILIVLCAHFFSRWRCF